MLTEAFLQEPARETLAAPPAWLQPEESPRAGEGGDSSGPGPAVSAPAELVLVFASTTEVLNAEDRLEAEGFHFSLIPVPKEINPNCGLALSFAEKIAPDISRALAAAGLAPQAAYRRLGGEFRGQDFFTRPAGEPSATGGPR